MKTIYDVDSASDLKTLLLADPTIADPDIKAKIFNFADDDLVFITKVLSGALKITDAVKFDPAFIKSHLR